MGKEIVTGGQREVAVAVVTTTATGASTTAATAAAVAEAAEEEDTAAGFNPSPVPDTNLLCIIYTPSLRYWFTVVTHFFFPARIVIQTSPYVQGNMDE